MTASDNRSKLESRNAPAGPSLAVLRATSPSNTSKAPAIKIKKGAGHAIKII